MTIYKDIITMYTDLSFLTLNTRRFLWYFKTFFLFVFLILGMSHAWLGVHMGATIIWKVTFRDWQVKQFSHVKGVKPRKRSHYVLNCCLLPSWTLSCTNGRVQWFVDKGRTTTKCLLIIYKLVKVILNEPSIFVMMWTLSQC